MSPSHAFSSGGSTIRAFGRWRASGPTITATAGPTSLSSSALMEGARAVTLCDRGLSVALIAWRAGVRKPPQGRDCFGLRGEGRFENPKAGLT